MVHKRRALDSLDNNIDVDKIFSATSILYASYFSFDVNITWKGNYMEMKIIISGLI